MNEQDIQSIQIIITTHDENITKTYYGTVCQEIINDNPLLYKALNE